jgi:predicted ATPase
MNSTGLGKTTLEAHVAELSMVIIEGREYVCLAVDSDKPVRWHITVKMAGADIRTMLGMALRKPSLLFKVLMHVLFK